jgi:hypothetical protein
VAAGDVVPNSVVDQVGDQAGGQIGVAGRRGGGLYLFPIIAAVAGSAVVSRHIQQVGPMTAELAVEATTGLDALPITPWAGLTVTPLAMRFDTLRAESYRASERDPDVRPRGMGDVRCPDAIISCHLDANHRRRPPGE